MITGKRRSVLSLFKRNNEGTIITESSASTTTCTSSIIAADGGQDHEDEGEIPLVLLRRAIALVGGRPATRRLRCGRARTWC